MKSDQIVHLYTLLLMVVFGTYCNAQNKTELPTGNTKSETKDVITSHVPNTMVRNIKQDRKGNILIASFGGIIRYDGKSFTNITSKISSPSFWDVLEDRSGNLWFSSRDSGVYYYDGKSFQHFTTQQGLANDQVLHIYEDKTGNIWFGTGSGASRYDGKSFRNYKMNGGLPGDILMVVSSLPDNDLTTIIEDKTGKFWFGTRGNAFIYDGKTFAIFRNKDGKAFHNVWSIIEDKKGNIWLGGNDGLWRYDGSTFTNFTQNFVGRVYEDKEGNIWTSALNDNGMFALSRYDEKSLSNKKPTVTEIKSQSAMLLGILEDANGNIWFGSGGGVYRYNGNTITDFKESQE